VISLGGPARGGGRPAAGGWRSVVYSIGRPPVTGSMTAAPVQLAYMIHSIGLPLANGLFRTEAF
jgi:hypothetical protein